MAKIVKILETTWTEVKPVRKVKQEYKVYFESGRTFEYTQRDNLSMSVVEFLMSDDVETNVRYFTNEDGIGNYDTVKYVTYKRNV